MTSLPSEQLKNRLQLLPLRHRLPLRLLLLNSNKTLEILEILENLKMLLVNLVIL